MAMVARSKVSNAVPGSSSTGVRFSTSEPVVHGLSCSLECLLRLRAWERILSPIGSWIQVPLVTWLLKHG